MISRIDGPIWKKQTKNKDSLRVATPFVYNLFLVSAEIPVDSNQTCLKYMNYFNWQRDCKREHRLDVISKHDKIMFNIRRLIDGNKFLLSRPQAE